MILVGLVGGYILGLVSSRRQKRRGEGYVCVRREKVVELVINRYERLGRNQALGGAARVFGWCQ